VQSDPDITVPVEVLRGALREALADLVARGRKLGAPDDAKVVVDLPPLRARVLAAEAGGMREYVRAVADDFDDGGEGVRLEFRVAIAGALSKIDERAAALALDLVEKKRGEFHVVFDPRDDSASVHIVSGGQAVTLGGFVEERVATC
jgi:hypothetical protein